MEHILQRFIMKPEYECFVMTFNNMYKPFGKFFSPTDKFSASWRLAFITIVILFIIGCLATWAAADSPAKSITVANSSHLNTKELEALQSAIQPFGAVQFFGADLRAIHTNVAKLSWVERVDVSRNWYQGVTVSVTPRKAIANFGSGHMVDANGVVFVPADKSQLMNDSLVTLKGYPEQATQIMTQMQRINTWYAPLGVKVTDLILTPRQTWVVEFDNNFKVVVDHENTEQKLYNLSVDLVNHYQERFSELYSADLRYHNGFVLQLKTVEHNRI